MHQKVLTNIFGFTPLEISMKWVYLFFRITVCIMIPFLDMPPCRAWLFRCKFSNPSSSHTSNFPGNSRQSNDSYLFLFLLLIFPVAFLSGELSTDSRQSSDSYFSSVQASPGLNIKLAQICLTNKSQP